jgi:bidirectional [NiFe] hydrogenase diaphorase subunit
MRPSSQGFQAASCIWPDVRYRSPHNRCPRRHAQDRRPGPVRARGRDHHRGLPREQDPDPEPVLDGRPLGRRRLPAVHGRDAGSNRLLAACSTRVAEGMEVQTNTEKLQRYRRTLVELLFAERNHVCSVCVSNGHCELQWLAQPAASTMCACPTATPATRRQQPRDVPRRPQPLRALHPLRARLRRDRGRPHLGRHGPRQQLPGHHRPGQPWGDSDTCTSCGKCVQVCPTGALVKQGTSVGEMVKDQHFLPILARRRHIR